MAPQGLSSTEFAVRLSVFFGAVFVVAGTQLPFLPVWLAARGLSVAEISFVTALPLLVRIVVTPAIAYVADLSGDHRKVLLVLTWASVAITLALSQAYGLIAIAVLVLAKALATTSVMPLTETVAMGGVRSRGLDYGRMRLWGSITFIVATVVGGAVITRWGAEAAIWVMAVGALMTALAAHWLPRREGGENGAPSRHISAADALALARSRSFVLFLITAGAVQAGHAVFYTYGVLHWQKQGISPTWAGALWAIGVIVEIGLFAFSRAAVQAVGAVMLLVIGALAAIIRWTAMAFDPPLAALFALQALHGLTFGATHLGAVHYIAENVPQEQAGTAQGLYAAVTAGIAMGLATLIAGQLYAAYGGGAYLAMAVLGAVGLSAAVALGVRAAPKRVSE